MLKINSINNCFHNINYLINSNYVNDSDLEYNDIKHINYFKHNGYRYEKYMFINLISQKNLTNIFKNINYNDGDFIKKFNYYNKYYISNPNNDFFLKKIKINSTKDISINKICDLNLSNFINDKYNKYFFVLEFIRNFYYYISSDSFIKNYKKNIYHFVIPTKYYISNDNFIIHNDFNTNVSFTVIINNNHPSIQINSNENITSNFIEFIKPIITYHSHLINNDPIISLTNKRNPTIKQITRLKNYAIHLSKLYDLYKFKTINNIIDNLKQDNIYVKIFKKNFFSIIANNYNSFINLTININKHDKPDINNDNVINVVSPPDKIIIEPPDIFVNEIDDYIDNITSDIYDNITSDINDNISEDIYDTITNDVTNDITNNIFNKNYIYIGIIVTVILTIILLAIILNNVSPSYKNIQIQNGGGRDNTIIYILCIILFLFITGCFIRINKTEKFMDFAAMLGNMGSISDLENEASKIDMSQWENLFKDMTGSDMEVSSQKTQSDTSSQSQNTPSTSTQTQNTESDTSTQTQNTESDTSTQSQNTESDTATQSQNTQSDTTTQSQNTQSNTTTQSQNTQSDTATQSQNTQSDTATQSQNTQSDTTTQSDSTTQSKNEKHLINIKNEFKNVDNNNNELESEIINLKYVNDETHDKSDLIDSNIETKSAEIVSAQKTIKEREKDLEKNIIDTRISKNKLEKEINTLNKLKNESISVSDSAEKTNLLASEITEMAQETSNLGKSNQSVTINTLANIDLDNFDFNTFDLNEFGKELDKNEETKNIDLSSINKFFQNTFDMDNAIEYAIQGNLKHNEDPEIHEEDIDKLINKLDLNGKIELNTNFENLSNQAKKLASASKEQGKLAYASQEIKKLQKNVTDTSNAASLVRILATIENAKKERIDKKIIYQNEKIKEIYKEIEFKKKQELDKIEKIQLEKELKRELDENLKLNLNNKKQLNLDIIEIEKELSQKEEESYKSKKLAKFILDKIGVIENKLITENIEKTNELERKEILDLVKLNIYNRDEIEDKLKKKYDNKQIEYEIELELERIRNKIKELEKNINQNAKSQVIYMKSINQIKIELNNYSAKSLSYKSLILTEETKYKKEKDDLNIIFESTNKNIENLINEELSLLKLEKESKNIEIKYNKLIIKLQEDLEKLKNSDQDLISNKKNEIDKLKLLIKLNKNKNLKLKNRYNIVIREREENVADKYKILNQKDKKKEYYDNILRKLNEEYEKTLIMENYHNKKLIKESFRLSELSKKHINYYREIFILNEKSETLLTKDITFIEKSYNNSLKEVVTRLESSLKVKKEEQDMESIVKLAKKNLENVIKIKMEKINKIKQEIVGEKNKILLEQKQNKLSILQTNTTTMEDVGIQKLKSANINYNYVIEKRILTELDQIKTQIDKVVFKIILLTKKTMKININILLLIIERNLEGNIFKKSKLDHDIIKNEIFRLGKMEKQGIDDIQKSKIILQEYSRLIIKDSSKKSYKELYDSQEKNVNILKIDIKNLGFKILNLKKQEVYYENNIEKIENKLINLDEIIKYKISQNEKILMNTINNLGEILKEYKTLASTYLQTREKIDDIGINIPKIALNPIPIPNKIKNELYRIFNDKKLEYKNLVHDNDFIKGIDNILKEYTKVVKNDEIKKNAAEIILIYDIKILNSLEFNHREKLILKNNIINELEISLNINKKYININNIIVDDNTVQVYIKINIHEKFLKIQDIIDHILDKYYDITSKLRKGTYGKNLIEIKNNIIELDKNNSDSDKKEEKNNKVILSDVLSITKLEDAKITKQYHYLLNNYDNDMNNKKFLLAHYPFKTNKNELTKNTLTNYNNNGRDLYKAIDSHDVTVKNIYENYITLDNTLLKAENIDLIHNKEFTISFLAKLLEGDRDQQILFSNGIISEYLQSNYVNWSKLNEKKNLKNASYNNNILTIGFLNNSLYIKLPCFKKNGEYRYYYHTPEIKNLFVKNNIWHHWVITMKNNIIEIYKDDFSKPALLWKIDNGYNDVNNTCINDNKKYDKTNLYIGGLKTDLDRNTIEINKIISYKGGLADLRIYKKHFTSEELRSLFIKNIKESQIKRQLVLPTKIKNDNEPKIIRKAIVNTKKNIKKKQNTQQNIEQNKEQNKEVSEEYEKTLPVIKKLSESSKNNENLLNKKIVRNKVVNMNYNEDEFVLTGNTNDDMKNIEKNIKKNLIENM